MGKKLIIHRAMYSKTNNRTQLELCEEDFQIFCCNLRICVSFPIFACMNYVHYLNSTSLCDAKEYFPLM
jgi:hypothetical protein